MVAISVPIATKHRTLELDLIESILIDGSKGKFEVKNWINLLNYLTLLISDSHNLLCHNTNERNRGGVNDWQSMHFDESDRLIFKC